MSDSAEIGTNFSPNREWRYTLERDTGVVAGQGTVLFICLNPSTADEQINDPTVRRCLGYAQRWGYARLLVGNAYAYRATDPTDMLHADDPVGPHNDLWLLAMVAAADKVVCAWGAFAGDGRVEELESLLSGFDHLFALGFTQAGRPRHPLYMRADVVLRPYMRQYVLPVEVH